MIYEVINNTCTFSHLFHQGTFQISTQLSLTTLASTAISTVDDSFFNDMTRSTGYLGRLALYSKGKPINHGLIGPGEYGVPDGEDRIIRLGKTIDVLPLARRPKAIDMSDLENIISIYEDGPEFQRIKAAADDKSKASDKGSGCMWGVSFLVFERKTGRFLEYFCGSGTSRKEAGQIYAFLPQVVAGESLPPRAITLTSRVIDSGNFSWHGSTITECSTPISNLPEVEVVMKEIMSFLKPKVDKAEKVDPAVAESRRAR